MHVEWRPRRNSYFKKFYEFSSYLQILCRFDRSIKILIAIFWYWIHFFEWHLKHQTCRSWTISSFSCVSRDSNVCWLRTRCHKFGIKHARAQPPYIGFYYRRHFGKSGIIKPKSHHSRKKKNRNFNTV